MQRLYTCTRGGRAIQGGTCPHQLRSCTTHTGCTLAHTHTRHTFTFTYTSRTRTRLHRLYHTCTGCTTHAPAVHTPALYAHTRSQWAAHDTRGRYTTRARPRMTRARPAHGRTAARDTRTRARARTRTRVCVHVRVHVPRRLFTRHSCHHRRRRRPAPPRARAARILLVRGFVLWRASAEGCPMSRPRAFREVK